jgi:hypothetical protein
LTGYIDKANKRTAITTVRSNIAAMQTLLTEEYALGGADWTSPPYVSPSGIIHNGYGAGVNADGTMTVQLASISEGRTLAQQAEMTAEWESLTGIDPFQTWASGGAAFVFQALIDPATYQIKGFGMVILEGSDPKYFVTWNLVESKAAVFHNGVVGTYFCSQVDDSGYQVFTPEEFMQLVAT